MSKLVAKLRDRRGVTILFAALVFLVCSLAGAAALTAAASNIGRYPRLQKEEQEYLAISSAAQLVAEALWTDGAGSAGFTPKGDASPRL